METTARAECARRPIIAMLFAAMFAVIAPANAAPKTYHDVYRQDLEFRRHCLVDGYKKSGLRDPKWDEKAIAFLEASAVTLATDGIDPFYWPKDRPTPATLVEQGNALVTTGCNDPLVLILANHWTGINIRHGSPFLRGELVPAGSPATRPVMRVIRFEQLKPLYDRLLESKYDNAIIAELTGARTFVISREPQSRTEVTRVARERWMAACKAGAPARLRQRLVALWGDRLPQSSRAMIHDPALAALIREHEKSLDPWTFHCLMARHLVEQVQLHPRRPIPVMTPLQRKDFDGKLMEAVNHLLAAQKLEPSLPEPFTDMILIATALKDQGDPLDWFGRALAAQVDYLRAYELLRETLRARADEGYQPLLDLAAACLVQPRYDTIVPWQYIETIRAIGAEQGRSWVAITEPTIYANLMKVLDGYIEQGSRKTYYQSVKAAVAFKGQKMSDCREILDQIIADGATVDPSAFAYLDIEAPAATIASIFLRTGKHWPQVSRAQALCTEKKYPEALKLARSIRDAVAADDPQRPALDPIVEDVEFLAGEWVALRHPTFGVSGRYGFQQVQCNLLISSRGGEDPVIWLHPDRDSRRKYSVWDGAEVRRNIQPDFEMELHLRFTDSMRPATSASTPAAGDPVTVGVLFFNRAAQHREFALADIGKQRVGFAIDDDMKAAWDAPVKNESVLTVRCVDRVVTILLDGKPVGEPHRLGKLLEAGFEVGIGGIDAWPVGVRQVRVRNLKQSS